MWKDNIDILMLQETHVNTNSTEIHDGYTFIFSTSISDKDREEIEKRTETGRGSRKGKGKGKGKGNIDFSKGYEYHGVGAVLSPKMMASLQDFEQFDGRLMYIKLAAHHESVSITNGYAQQSMKPYQENEFLHQTRANT